MVQCNVRYEVLSTMRLLDSCPAPPSPSGLLRDLPLWHHHGEGVGHTQGPLPWVPTEQLGALSWA